MAAITNNIQNSLQSAPAPQSAPVPDSNFEAVKQNSVNDPSLQPLTADVDHTEADADGGGGRGASGGGKGGKPAKTGEQESRPTGLRPNEQQPVTGNRSLIPANPSLSQFIGSVHSVFGFQSTAPLAMRTTAKYMLGGALIPAQNPVFDRMREHISILQNPRVATTFAYYKTAVAAAAPQLAFAHMQVSGSPYASDGSGYLRLPTQKQIEEYGKRENVPFVLDQATSAQNGGRSDLSRFFGAPVAQIRTYGYLPPAKPAQTRDASSSAPQQGMLLRLTAGALPMFVRPADGKPMVASLGGLLSGLLPQRPAKPSVGTVVTGKPSDGVTRPFVMTAAGARPSAMAAMAA